ncbi:hypothetical protein [Streptomyces sp. NPDC002104]
MISSPAELGLRDRVQAVVPAHRLAVVPLFLTGAAVRAAGPG